MEEKFMMLERYRSDRRKLLECLISSPILIKQVLPSSDINNINLDTLSADYVIDCINSGGVLDVAKATASHYQELQYPTMIHSQSGNTFFTLSQSQLSRSPPKRQPPRAAASDRTKVAPPSSIQAEILSKNRTPFSKDEKGLKSGDVMTRPSNFAESGLVPSLGLPHLQTGLSDDDLRESAYTTLVASLVSRIEVLPQQSRRNDKASKLISGLKGKKSTERVPIQAQDRKLELLNTIRTQMEVSEAMDLCIRKSLARCVLSKSCVQIDVLHIVLGLVKSTSRSSFPNAKSYVQWKNRQANILEELCCLGHLTTEYPSIKSSIGKIRNARDWDLMSPTEQAEILISIRDSASIMWQKPGSGDQSWDLSSGHHLKVRLYEKLLFSLFDILEEGQILAEANEILKLIQLTWSTLGITQTIHDALYSWVLFKQFVQTDREDLLQYATIQMQKLLSDESLYGGECLLCTIEWRESVVQLNLVPAILLSMNIWCDGKLRDYHRHFIQKPSQFKRILSFAMATAVLDLNEFGELKKPSSFNEDASRRLKKYIESSVHAAYMQVHDCLDQISNLERMHPLALLANAVTSIAEKEFTIFCPVLHEWCPEAGMISATLLYQLFQEKLSPFTQGISCLSQDVKAVLAAAFTLDRKLIQLYSFSYEMNSIQPFEVDLDHFQIGDMSASLILDWLLSQHVYIMDWIGRAFDLEEWEPLSSQQKHAVSVVEVFRMIEETVDQFFGLILPLNITHLQALLSLVIHSLDAYLTKMVGQLVEESHLYPPIPSLTRYEETLVPIARKKTVELKILDDNSSNIINQLTISKLCVILNTLQYIRNQINLLEEDVRKSWGLVRRSVKRKWFNIVEEEGHEVLERTMSMSEESIDELFTTTFDGIRNSTLDGITKFINFIGTRAVFWDLRESFLFQLYRGGVERARLDAILPHIDAVLDQICQSVDYTMRDPVVLRIFQASLEGYLWVLLDGGPSRAFSDSDISLMEDDLRTLQDFFVADGKGLPRSTVERETKFTHQVLGLFSLQTSSVIQMLMTASGRISTRVQPPSHSHRSFDDANILIRILCHKKDTHASAFLKQQYRLPPSSDYEGNPKNESTSSSAVISDLLRRSSSLRFSETGRSSFKSLKKKINEAW